MYKDPANDLRHLRRPRQGLLLKPCSPAPRMRSPGPPLVAATCTAIALACSELPLALIDEHGLAERTHERGGEKEVRFYWQANPTLLPVVVERQSSSRAGGAVTAERRAVSQHTTGSIRLEGFTVKPTRTILSIQPGRSDEKPDGPLALAR